MPWAPNQVIIARGFINKKLGFVCSIFDQISGGIASCTWFLAWKSCNTSKYKMFHVKIKLITYLIK